MSSPNNDRYSVLIADDSEVCCGLLALVLRNADYDVTCVYDGMQAIEATRARAFDVVILDNEMPKLDGLATLEGIRALRPHMPAMVCSGNVAADQVARYERLGVENMFGKPINPLRLKQQVAKVVEHHRQLAAADTHRDPALQSHTPFLAPGSDARIMEKPFFSGVSPAARKLVDDFMRVRRFKTAATLEGRSGTGFLDVAVGMAEAKNALLLACPAAEVDEMKLIMLFAPALLQDRGVILIITNAERLTQAQQAVLEGLYTGQGALDPYYLGKVSLIFCAEASLHELADDGQFDERLLLRAGAMALRLPDLSQRHEDVFLIARAILRRIGAGRFTFTHEAQLWLEKQSWAGDYRQLHRTVELASRLTAESDPIDVIHLAAAFSKEPVYQDPLFHETLLETLYEFTGLENL